MAKYSVGDIVTVTARQAGHEYEIGDKVRITEVLHDDGAYRSEPVLGGHGWAVIDDEITPQLVAV